MNKVVPEAKPAEHNPLKQVACRTCFKMQVPARDGMCRHGNHPFVELPDTPLKGLPLPVRPQAPPPRRRREVQVVQQTVPQYGNDPLALLANAQAFFSRRL